MNSEEKLERRGVDLGFVEPCEANEAWRLESRFFPSKVGGRPAWLHLSKLPSEAELQCGRCHQPCVFLCQLYAPVQDNDECFHRTLFVFMCRSAACCTPNDSSNFIIFRCQLKRSNEFYPYDPPEDRPSWQTDLTAEKWTPLCAVCGCRGGNHCGRCKRVKYCSREHQVLHWKEGHKAQCNPAQSTSKEEEGTLSFLLPEFELVIECEGMQREGIDESDDNSDDSDKEEEKRMEDFTKLKHDGQLGSLADDETVDADLLRMAACDEDRVFNAFKTKLAQNPGQVLRYDRGGTPLWLSEVHTPEEKDIPACSCGSRRIYEFQILPQLLSHLSLDSLDQSIDWGILSVFTCERNCNEGSAYKREFLWKQDVIA